MKVSLSIFQFKNKSNKNKISLSTGKKSNSNIISFGEINPFQKETPSCVCRDVLRIKASYTLEAAVVIPFFVCFLVSIMFFFRILEMQLDVESALQYAARETAVVSYEKKLQESGPLLVSATALFEEKLAKTKYPKQLIRSKLVLIDYLQSDVKGDYIDLYTTYQMELPFRLFGDKTIQIEQRAKAKKWIGFQKDEKAQNNDTWVYITETGKVYHKSKDCTYLKLSIHSAKIDEIKNLRNKNGGKYDKCDLCKNFGSTIYITDYGNTYHSTLNCPGLKRTIYKVLLSSIKDYKACSKCARGE